MPKQSQQNEAGWTIFGVFLGILSGLAGLDALLSPPKQEPGESDNQYNERLRKREELRQRRDEWWIKEGDKIVTGFIASLIGGGGIFTILSNMLSDGTGSGGPACKVLYGIYFSLFAPGCIIVFVLVLLLRRPSDSE